MSGPLDRNSPVPLYYQFKQHLLERFENDEFSYGEPIPPEMELVKDYQISRATVRHALQEMEHEGYINRISGKGTFILRTRIKRGLTRMSSFTEDMQERGQKVISKVLDSGYNVPPLYISEQFGIAHEGRLLYIYRLRLVDDLPIALTQSYIKTPASISITLEELQTSISVWTLLEDKGLFLIETDKVIEAILANEERAALLDIPVGAALLQTEGMAYTTNHQPIEYSLIFSPGERYKYMMHLER